MNARLRWSFLFGLVLTVLVLGFSSHQFESTVSRTSILARTESWVRVSTWFSPMEPPAYYDYLTRSSILLSTVTSSSVVEVGEDNREQIITFTTTVAYSTSVTKIFTRTMNLVKITLSDNVALSTTMVQGKSEFNFMRFVLFGLVLFFTVFSVLFVLCYALDRLRSVGPSDERS